MSADQPLQGNRAATQTKGYSAQSLKKKVYVEWTRSVEVLQLQGDRYYGQFDIFRSFKCLEHKCAEVKG